MEGYGATAVQEEAVGGMEGNNNRVQKDWAIICPGPSLNHHYEFKHDEGCLIAVNMAILKKVPDWWAMIDNEVFEDVLNKIDIDTVMKKTTLWIPNKWQERRGYGRIDPIFDGFKKEAWADLNDEGLPGRGIPWITKTIFAAIALAIKKNAKTIRIYGADMAGEGYFVKGMSTVRQLHDSQRWAEERRNISAITRACNELGIEILLETIA